MIIISAFNLYKGGSRRLYEEITNHTDNDVTIVGFHNRNKKNRDTRFSFFYPISRYNIIYRFALEQLAVLIIALIYRPKKLIMMGNFPCILWFGPQEVYFHNLDYLKVRERTLKDRLERQLFLMAIRLKRPKILCQTIHTQKECQSVFSSAHLIVEVLPIPADILVKKCEEINRLQLDRSQHGIYPTSDHPYKNISILYQLKNKNSIIPVDVTIYNPAYGSSEVVHQIGRGNHNEILTRIATSKAMIFLSEYESLGYPLIEATLLNTPVIAIDRAYVQACIETPYLFHHADELQSILEIKRLDTSPKLQIILSTKQFFAELKK